MRRQITFAGQIYDRTQALIDGTVKPEGLELNWLILHYPEIWRRMLNDYDFDASELSLSSYLIAKSMGKPLIAIPVFPARTFRHSYVFINRNSGIKQPSDLIGKRVGVADFQQTATVWMRGILQHEYNVPLEEIQWFTWQKTRMEIDLPKQYKIQEIAPGKNPEEMLKEGELDAVILAAMFPSLLQGTPETRRLFENYKEVEQAYFQKTKIFPIMHTVAIREELWKEQPWIAVSLLKAFQQAKEIAYSRLVDLNAYKISLIWMRDVVREQQSVVGTDPWAYGFEKNRHVLEAIAGYLYDQRLIKKPLNVEEAFAPNTLAL
ncbi:MAG TPA: ABC transporter substrate-binding protein [Candidatus Binatia bacterium]|jgi:4,5-dihydroxyphthalate decarboxylase